MSTNDALLRTFERLYRCNGSAFGLYPSLGNFLYDPPFESRKEGNTGTNTTGDAAASRSHGDFGAWLLSNNEWEAAYQYYVEKLYERDDREDRVRAALAALNLNRIESVTRWLLADSSFEAQGMLALAYYRVGDYDASATLSARVLKSANVSQWKCRAAVLYLASCLNSRTVPDPSLETNAVATVLNPSEAELFSRELRSISNPRRSVVYAGASVIPGLGQLLNGYEGDALIAFTCCTLLGLGAWSSFAHENVSGGILFSSLFCYAYIANIRSGSASAMRKSVDKAIELRARLYVVFNPTRTFVELRY